MTPKKPKTGMCIDGIFASEAIDSSGEIVSISGMDISTMEAGESVANYEHLAEDGNYGREIVGKVVYAKKILKASDCEDSRQEMYWKKIKGIPFLYGVIRLYDGAGHEGAKALAAQIRDHVANDEPILVRYSIEGTTTKKVDNEIKSSIAKKVALTLKPCNKTCDSGLVADPNAPEGFGIQKTEAQFIDPEFAPLGAGFAMECNPCMDRKTEASIRLLSTAMKLRVIKKAVALHKATSAGGMDGAPSQRTGGAALQREDISGTVKAALRDYGWERPFRRAEFKAFSKAKLPEVSEDFLNHFADIAEAYSIKKSMMKKEGDEPKVKAPKVIKEPKAKAVKAVKVAKPAAPDFQPGGHAVIEDISDSQEALPDETVEKGAGHSRNLSSGTFRGKKLKENKGMVRPEFDAKSGILHTPAGSFKAYLPEHDGPESAANYQKLLSHPDIEAAMDTAMTNWTKVHKLFKAGKLPPEVVMHAVMFAGLSPNKSVPIQEIQFCLDQDTILVTCAGQKKAIKDFLPGDELWGVDAEGKTIRTSVVRLFDQGVLAGWEAEFEDGYKVVCSSNHKFLTEKGMIPLEKIVQDRLGVLGSSQDAEGGLVGVGSINNSSSTARSLVLRSVVRVRAVGLRQMYDIEVSHPEHNFLLPNGVVTSNSRLVDAMDATGIDPRDPGFERIREPYQNLDHPTTLPHVARDEFARNPAYYVGGKIGVERDAEGNKVGEPSDTGRYPGELQSGRPLFEDFLSRASKYHQIHDHVVNLIGRNAGNGFDAVAELMRSKSGGTNWNNKRRSALKAGRPDPGEYQGVDIPGIKVKTGLYTLGMLGGGDSLVPDTHEVRNLYGLDIDKDGDTIDYLKQLHWRPTNMEGVMRPLNEWYLKNHPAVKYTLNHPKWGSHFERPQDALFPSFWRHWLTIQPHEKFIGLGNHANNAATTHAPFWDTIRPHVDKALGLLGKAEGGDECSIPLRTAMVHQQYVRDYGEVPASLLYYHNLAPKLLEAAEHRQRFGDSMRFLTKANAIQACLIDLRKSVDDALKGPELPEFHKLEIHVNGKKHPAGRFMIYNNHLHHLEDYHGILDAMLPEGPITAKTISRLHGLQWSPKTTTSRTFPGDGNKTEPQVPKHVVAVSDDPVPPPPPVFEYHRPGMERPHIVEFGSGGAALDGKKLNDAELALMINNSKSGLATIRYRKNDSGSLMKSDGHPEHPEPDELLNRIRVAEAAGHLPPGTAAATTHHMLEDSLTNANIGNKKAYQLFRGKKMPGVYVSMDANSFKRVNDDFSHDHGDAAITGIGKALRSAADKVGTGKLFRPGGDEFVAHFPSQEEAHHFIRHATQHIDKIPAIGGVHKLSMSFGLGKTFPSSDKALYASKAQKLDPVTGLSKYSPQRTPHLAHSEIPGSKGPINLHSDSPPQQHLPPQPQRRPAKQA